MHKLSKRKHYSQNASVRLLGDALCVIWDAVTLLLLEALLHSAPVLSTGAEYVLYSTAVLYCVYYSNSSSKTVLLYSPLRHTEFHCC